MTVKLVFFSNFASPHILPLCDSLFARLGDDFRFVETRSTTAERLSLGYREFANRNYLVPYDPARTLEELQGYADQASIVMFSLGSIDYAISSKRVRENRPTIALSERLFKRGMLKLFDPKLVIQVLRNLAWRRRQLWLLTMGHYVAHDFVYTGFRRDRIRRFGYYPETEQLSLDELLKKKTYEDVVHIVWVGRFIGWKRPGDAVSMAVQLRERGLNSKWRLEILGDGPERPVLERAIARNHLQNHVSLPGIRSKQEVEEKLRQADILVMTSNRREGWGAVVNEAMTRACAVVASREAGGAREIILDGENGRLFHSGDIYSLTEIVTRLVMNPDERHRLGSNAYDCIFNVWNADNAAARLVEVMENGFEIEYTEGPLSRPQP